LNAYKKAGGNFELYVLCNGQLPSDVYLSLDNLSVAYFRTDNIKIHTKLIRKLKYGQNPYKHISAFVLANKIDILYPLLSYDEFHNSIPCKTVYWIPDFQHKILPQFFSQQELDSRNIQFEAIVRNAKHLILSSNDALTHFKRFYPDSQVRTSLLQFKSIIEKNKLPSLGTIRLKYDMPESYFMVANQFWAHKNHKVVLEAILCSKKAGVNVCVVFSGKPYDKRQPEYFDHLLSFIQANSLENSVFMVGFIPRLDQLALMKGSTAVIQPSKFEGWSTVIEDAKSLNKIVICSSIAIHQEQLGDKGIYFEQNDSDGLSKHLNRLLIINNEKIDFPDFTEEQYGQQLLQIIENA